MARVETTLYGLDRFEDGTEEGYRLFSSTDRLWEARDHPTAESRIYEDRLGNWHAKVRFPETDDEDAWDYVAETAERIEDEYGIDLEINQREFHRMATDGREGPSKDDIAIKYQSESDIDLDTNDIDRKLGLALLEASYLAKGTGSGVTLGATSGAITGFLAGSPGGPAGAAAGAVLGSVFGGTIGTVGTMKQRIDDRYEPYGFVSEKNREKKHRKWTEKANDLREWWIRRNSGPDNDIFEDINRRNALQHILSDGDYDSELNSELDDLEAADLDKQRERLMAITFHEFEHQPGVTATRETDSYGEAYRFVQTVVDGDPAEPDEPSLYRSEDAFTQVFDHLVEDGDLSADAEQLVKDVYNNDETDPAIEEWVSDRYELPDSLERDLLL